MYKIGQKRYPAVANRVAKQARLGARARADDPMVVGLNPTWSIELLFFFSALEKFLAG